MSRKSRIRFYDSIVFPSIVNVKNQYQVGGVVAVLAIILYLSTNRFHFFVPRQLTMSSVDLMVPFMPWTLWVYLSEYILFAVVYLTLPNPEVRNKYLYAFLALQLVSIFIFIIWPTTYPRELFSLENYSGSSAPITLKMFEILRGVDSPASCAPSLHVSSCYLSALSFLGVSLRKSIFFLSWATLVAISTLTTKQHYFFDLYSGLFLALALYFIFFYGVKYKQK